MTTGEGHTRRFGDIVKLKFDIDAPLKVQVSLSYNGDCWETVNLAKAGRQPSLGSEDLFTQKYRHPKKIAPAKVADVESLYPYIPAVHLEDYRNMLKHVQDNEESSSEDETEGGN